MANPRNPEKARHSTAVRLPADLLDRLDAEAEKRTLSRNKLIELMLAAGLARLEEPTVSCPLCTAHGFDHCTVDAMRVERDRAYRDRDEALGARIAPVIVAEGLCFACAPVRRGWIGMKKDRDRYREQEQEIARLVIDLARWRQAGGYCRGASISNLHAGVVIDSLVALLTDHGERFATDRENGRESADKPHSGRSRT